MTMMASLWSSMCASALELRNLSSRVLAPSLVDYCLNSLSRHNSVPPLNFPEIHDGLPQLLQLGVKQSVAHILYEQFTESVRNIDETLREQYLTEAPKLCEDTSSFRVSRLAYIEALKDFLVKLRTQTVERIWNAQLSHVERLVKQGQSLSTGHSVISPSSSRSSGSSRRRQGRPQTFTKQQTAALNALLVHDDQFSSEEKDLIAHELNLSREQVNRWFCNARARRKPYSKRPRRSESTLETTLSDYSRNSPSSKSDQMSNQGSMSSRSSNSGDCSEDMIITTASSSSNSSSESGDERMEDYFDFPAYQTADETWAHRFNASTPNSSQSLDLFNFNPLDPNLSSIPNCSSPSIHSSSLLWS